jgi:hypothetical protein
MHDDEITGDAMKPREVEMGQAAAAFAVVLQIPDLTISMMEELDTNGGDVQRVASDMNLRRIWQDAAPEARAAVLLSLAWAARDRQLPEAADAAGRYAAELHRSATLAGDADAFLGPAFPVLPYRGRAGDVATSLAHDPDAAPLSLTVALLLAAAVRSPDEASEA